MKKKNALTELCDLLAEDGGALSHDGLNSLLWSQCPSPESLSDAAFRPTARQVDGILAAARYLSRSKEPENSNFDGLLALVVQFIATILNISRTEAWPVLFTPDVFEELLGYLAEISVKWPHATLSVSNVLTDFVLNVTEESSEGYPAIRSLLLALASNFPALDSADADSLANCLLRDWLLLPPTPMEASASFQSLSAPSSPVRFFFSSNGKASSMKDLQEYLSDIVTNFDDDRTFFTPNSTPGGTPGREPENFGHKKGNGSRNYDSEYADGKKRTRQLLTALEGESVVALERQELGFRLFEQILGKVEVHEELVSQLRIMAISQLTALVPFLKARLLLLFLICFALLVSNICGEVERSQRFMMLTI